MSIQFLPVDKESISSQIVAGTVLVVEDDSGDEFFILRALKGTHMSSNVVVVRDGEEATDYVFKAGKFSTRSENTNPKVIILDLCLPKIAGLEVLRLIKEDPKTTHIPVVVMTSSESKADIVRCYKLGANSVVRKGRFIEEFRESVALAVVYWTRVNVY
ncbi:MAG: response regulator [Chlorobia bacterium]|nr:response regulator [Fimbriimonadaceae bacterium]